MTPKKRMAKAGRSRGYNNGSPIVANRQQRIAAVLLPLLQRYGGSYNQVAAHLFRLGLEWIDSRAVARWAQGVVPYEYTIRRIEDAIGRGAARVSSDSPSLAGTGRQTPPGMPDTEGPPRRDEASPSLEHEHDD